MTVKAARERRDRKRPLCREPWQAYYILRRGVLPCCYGANAIAPMSEWATAWNSPAMQEIRSYLAEGKLSPYCLVSYGCPIVQREMQTRRRRALLPALVPSAASPLFRTINRLLGGVPAMVYRRLTRG